MRKLAKVLRFEIPSFLSTTTDGLYFEDASVGQEMLRAAGSFDKRRGSWEETLNCTSVGSNPSFTCVH